jgi:ribonuclease BN (tRNA processing enzyme)
MIKGSRGEGGCTGEPPKGAEGAAAVWAEDFKMKPLVAVDVKEVSAAGPVTQDDNGKVSAIIVEHPPVKPALGYRFDFKDRSIAFSGDTAPLEALAKMAKGADVLVHEAMYVPALESYTRDEIAKGRPVKFEDLMAHLKADHTPVEDVGRIGFPKSCLQERAEAARSSCYAQIL